MLRSGVGCAGIVYIPLSRVSLIVGTGLLRNTRSRVGADEPVRGCEAVFLTRWDGVYIRYLCVLLLWFRPYGGSLFFREK